MNMMLRIHREADSYWAEAFDLPGCFASGWSLSELSEAIFEAIDMCLKDDEDGNTQ